MMRASWQRLDPGKAKVMPVGQGKHLLPRVGVGGGEGGRPRCRPALRTGLLSDPGLLLGSQGAAVGESASFHLRGATRLRPFLSDAGRARNPRHLQTALLPTRSALGGSGGGPRPPTRSPQGSAGCTGFRLLSAIPSAALDLVSPTWHRPCPLLALQLGSEDGPGDTPPLPSSHLMGRGGGGYSQAVSAHGNSAPSLG